MRYFKLAVSTAALAGLAAPALLGVTAASAGTDPGVPAQSQVRHHHGLRPEFFTIRIVNHGNSDNPGAVRAFGPVSGYATDTETSPTTGVFDFGYGTTVNVLHSDVSNVQPVVDLQSCTATADATGHWLFDGGTGRYRNAFGFGAFRFHLLLVFRKHHHHKCKIGPKTQPETSVIDVTAFGKATAGNRHDGH